MCIVFPHNILYVRVNGKPRLATFDSDFHIWRTLHTRHLPLTPLQLKMLHLGNLLPLWLRCLGFQRKLWEAPQSRALHLHCKAVLLIRTSCIVSFNPREEVQETDAAHRGKCFAYLHKTPEVNQKKRAFGFLSRLICIFALMKTEPNIT